MDNLVIEGHMGINGMSMQVCVMEDGLKRRIISPVLGLTII